MRARACVRVRVRVRIFLDMGRIRYNGERIEIFNVTESVPKKKRDGVSWTAPDCPHDRVDTWAEQDTVEGEADMLDDVARAVCDLAIPGHLVKVSEVAALVPHASANAIGRAMTALGGTRKRGPVDRNGYRHWGYHFEALPVKPTDGPPYVLVGSVGGVRLYVERGQAGLLAK